MPARPAGRAALVRWRSRSWPESRPTLTRRERQTAANRNEGCHLARGEATGPRRAIPVLLFEDVNPWAKLPETSPRSQPIFRLKARPSIPVSTMPRECRHSSEALERALESFAGTVLAVSRSGLPAHDGPLLHGPARRLGPRVARRRPRAAGASGARPSRGRSPGQAALSRPPAAAETVKTKNWSNRG